MRLAARIGKLEKRYPPPPPGCDLCRGRFVWFEKQFKRVEIGGRLVPTCAVCGVLLPMPLKYISGIDLEDVL